MASSEGGPYEYSPGVGRATSLSSSAMNRGYNKEEEQLDEHHGERESAGGEGDGYGYDEEEEEDDDSDDDEEEERKGSALEEEGEQPAKEKEEGRGQDREMTSTIGTAPSIPPPSLPTTSKPPITTPPPPTPSLVEELLKFKPCERVELRRPLGATRHHPSGGDGDGEDSEVARKAIMDRLGAPDAKTTITELSLNNADIGEYYYYYYWCSACHDWYPIRCCPSR